MKAEGRKILVPSSRLLTALRLRRIAVLIPSVASSLPFRRLGAAVRPPFGCYNSQAPALLAGGVVACPERGPLVSPPRFADAVPPLPLGSAGGAVALAPVAAAANDHQPVASGAVEHPVAVLDTALRITFWVARSGPAQAGQPVASFKHGLAARDRATRERFATLFSMHAMAWLLPPRTGRSGHRLRYSA